MIVRLVLLALLASLVAAFQISRQVVTFLLNRMSARAIIAIGRALQDWDASRGLLTYAAAQTARFGSRAKTISANLNDPLPSLGSFDVVVCSLVLHYLKDWQPLLSALKAILHPGGRLEPSRAAPV